MIQIQIQINDDGSMGAAAAIDSEPLQTTFWTLAESEDFVKNNPKKVAEINAAKEKVDALYPGLIEAAMKHEKLIQCDALETELREANRKLALALEAL